jgi:hypothetical protein
MDTAIPTIEDVPERTDYRRFDWRRLTTHQIGRYVEYYVKMELTMFGFEVYTTEVDDRCIDFVARRHGLPFIEVQVKCRRVFHRSGNHYVYMEKSKFTLDDNRYLALGLVFDGEPPHLYLIPASVWRNPNHVFVSRDYSEGMKSKPEWGLNITEKNLPALEPYKFEKTVAEMIESQQH